MDMAGRASLRWRGTRRFEINDLRFKLEGLIAFKPSRGRVIIWRGLERRWNANPLRYRQRLRFQLSADQNQPAKKNGSDNQKVGQNWHSHRLSLHLGIRAHVELWLSGVQRSVLHITYATNCFSWNSHKNAALEHV
jgi:hypothetical protein